MTEAPIGGPDREATRVFVSCKRSEASEFVNALRNALIERGHEVFVDTKDIEPGEGWKKRIDALILNADVVVFVITPGAVRGWDGPIGEDSICRWEVRRAVELDKLLIPVVLQTDAVAEAPQEVRALNWVSFEGAQIANANDPCMVDGLAKLEGALRLKEILWTRWSVFQARGGRARLVAVEVGEGGGQYRSVQRDNSPMN